MTGPRRRRWALALAGLAAVLLVAVPFVQALGGSPARSDLGTGEPSAAPALRGTGFDGQVVDLSDLRGNVVLVNIWASWCAPCRREMPLLASIARQQADGGLRVVGVNTNDRREAAQDFLADIGGSGRVLHIYDPDGEHAVEWGSRGVPETFVVDARGRVVERHFGEVTQEWLQKSVLPLLDT